MEVQSRQLRIVQATVSADGLRVRLQIDGLWELFVHEMIADGVRNQSGDPLVYPFAWYTLNQIPREHQTR